MKFGFLFYSSCNLHRVVTFGGPLLSGLNKKVKNLSYFRGEALLSEFWGISHFGPHSCLKRNYIGVAILLSCWISLLLFSAISLPVYLKIYFHGIFTHENQIQDPLNHRFIVSMSIFNAVVARDKPAREIYFLT